MTEHGLLELTRSATQAEVGYFTQVITINFAMVVAIYYFLHQARLPMKAFAPNSPRLTRLAGMADANWPQSGVILRAAK